MKVGILYPTFCPVASVKGAIADSFGDVWGLHFLRASEVGDGSSYFQDA